jgi:hypothetical protein
LRSCAVSPFADTSSSRAVVYTTDLFSVHIMIGRQPSPAEFDQRREITNWLLRTSEREEKKRTSQGRQISVQLTETP